jgi:phosphoribosyl 1,2-cyclic phosphate phosphodiesterase
MIKNPPLKVTILGSGNSTGVPAAGGFWGDCDSKNPKNKRSRASIAVQSETTTLIIDTGPEFREQVNSIDAPDIDAVLYTHEHGDHINGIDDLRVFRLRNKHLVDIYGMPRTLDALKAKFIYLFESLRDLYPVIVKPHEIMPEDYGQVMTVGDISFIPFEQDHGGITSLGYHFGRLAYSTDMKDLNQESKELLKDVEIWIADASDYKKPEEISYVHCNLQNLYDLNESVNAKLTYLTHLTPYMDYDTVNAELPGGYKMSYDGLVIDA